MGDLLIVALEVEQALFELLKIGKVVWREHFTLHDREIDLDLVEPARMDGRMDNHTVRPLLTEPIDTTLSAMNGSIVDDPEHAPGLVIRAAVS